MKVIEKLLFEMNSQNMAESLDKIQAQIKYFAKNKMDVEGISLMTIRDQLDITLTDKILRDNGYILTIAQFKEDSEKFIRLADNDPISFNSRLKRLHNSYLLLRENYSKGTVKNKAVIDEMTKRFSEIILSSYCGNDDAKKMPEELWAKIGKMIENEIEQLNDNWLKDKLSLETKKEFNDLLSTRLLQDWQNTLLDANVITILQGEKDSINSVAALLVHFRNNKLPEDTQGNILTAVIEELNNEISGGKLTASSALGSEINVITNNSLRKDPYFIVSRLVSNWQNTQTSTEVTKQLEKHISCVIGKMKENLQPRLTQQFEQMATQIFTEKLRAGEYNNKQELLDVIKKHTLSIAKQLLLSSEPEVSSVSKCKEAIYKDVMHQLQDEWTSNRLSENENLFIQENVFSFLDDIDNKIRSTVWLTNTKHTVEKVSKENGELRKEVNELKRLMTQLLARTSEKNRESEAVSTAQVEKNTVKMFFK